jgi:FlaA1/EpsC-like NDP-sugar epimerase
MRDLVIYGAGGFGAEAVEVAEEINRDESVWNILGFIDDDEKKHESVICNYPVLGGQERLIARHTNVAICQGQSRLRRKIAIELSSRKNITFATQW